MKKNEKHKFEIGEILILITCVLLITTFIFQYLDVNLQLYNTVMNSETQVNESIQSNFFETFLSLLICLIFIVLFIVAFIIVDAALYFLTIGLISFIIWIVRSFYNLFTHFLPLPYFQKFEFIRGMVKNYIPYSRLIRIFLISLSTLVLCVMLVNPSYVQNLPGFIIGAMIVIVCLTDAIGMIYLASTCK